MSKIREFLKQDAGLTRGEQIIVAAGILGLFALNRSLIKDVNKANGEIYQKELENYDLTSRLNAIEMKMNLLEANNEMERNLNILNEE